MIHQVFRSAAVIRAIKLVGKIVSLRILPKRLNLVGENRIGMMSMSDAYDEMRAGKDVPLEDLFRALAARASCLRSIATTQNSSLERLDRLKNVREPPAR